MKMQLTDTELRGAVRNYVRDVVGINLKGKSLTIAFSATRLEGIVTSLDITNDIVVEVAQPDLPGYSVDQPDVTAVDAPALAEPAADPATPEVAAAAEADATLGDPVQKAETVVEAAPVVASTTEPEAADATPGTPEATVVETTPAPKTTATLFGKPTPTAA